MGSRLTNRANAPSADGPFFEQPQVSHEPASPNASAGDTCHVEHPRRSGSSAKNHCGDARAQTPERDAGFATQEASADDRKIDFERAKELFRKRQNGGRLTTDEEAFLKRAIAARQRGQGAGSGQGRDARMLPPKETTGFKPLDQMTADERYFDQDGGLYGGGSNEPTADHRAAAERELAKIVPLNGKGEPDADGHIVLVSISMSNATQEFSRFKQIADADPDKSIRLTIVDCAQGGQAMAEWVKPDAQPWSEATRRLERAGVTPAQVQVAWIKLANKGPRGDLQTHGRKLQDDTRTVIQNAKARFPNLRVAYLSSRIYGGYKSSPLNPEPYAYESAFAVRWLIQEQTKGSAALKYQAPGNTEQSVNALLLLWGPYLWGDGITPRKSDGLVWKRDDLAGDGTHPSQSGREKVAHLPLSFFNEDQLACGWFIDSEKR